MTNLSHEAAWKWQKGIFQILMSHEKVNFEEKDRARGRMTHDDDDRIWNAREREKAFNAQRM